MPTGTKGCTKCGVDKPLDDFPRSPQCTDGRAGDCRQCRSEYRREWGRKNRERSRLVNRAWYEENRERRLAAGAQWYRENSERSRANAAAWRAANPDTWRSYSRKWAKENPERAAEGAQRYRARRRGSTTLALSVDDLNDVLASGACLACGATERLTVEHLIPLARGGQHARGNLALLCLSCNSSKGSDTWTEWKYGKKPRARLVFG